MKSIPMNLLKTSFLLMSLVFILSLNSCDKDCGEPNSFNDPVYFQYDAQNFAWGIYHVGWFIDKNGDFRSYDLPANWNEPDSLGYISKSDLESNLGKADSIIYHISIPELQNQVALINDVDDDKFSAIENVGADIGTVELFCYKWDEGHNAYKRIRLVTGGDFKQENLDPEAKELAAWLIALGEESGSFYWY
ncbi:MAG TPA: hypothetical protein VFG10_15500 [Saprospiraceae bacterium]|nr:hypothetical protein [Saprospiraceae bacterium]